MTKVFCNFIKCEYIDYNEDDLYGVCMKDYIILDDRIEDIFCGCPDAKWCTEEDD